MTAPRAPLRAEILVATGALAVSVLLSFAVGLGMQWLGALVPRFSGSLLAATLVEGCVYTAAALWMLGLTTPERPALRSGFRAVEPRWILIGAGLGLALHGPADLVEACAQRLWPLGDAALLERAQRLAPDSLAERAALLLGVAGLVPVVEEAFFRGALFSLLERVGAGFLAITVSSLCFTVSHAEPRSWAALAIVAAVLGLLRQASGSLLPCILLHATFNATSLLVAFAQPPSAAFVWPSLAASAAGTLLSAGLLVLMSRRVAATSARHP